MCIRDRTTDDDGTKIVVMTSAQADAINQKYKDMERELNALKATIRFQRDTITKQQIVIQTQYDTIVQKDIVIKTQTDTITKYNEKVVYVEVEKTQTIKTVQTDLDSVTTELNTLKDTIWKWAIGPTLIFTDFPEDTIVYAMDFSKYYMHEKEFVIYFEPMSERQYNKYRSFIGTYGMSDAALWKFRNNYKVKRYVTDRNKRYVTRSSKFNIK
jgi:hypothetical protein